MSYLVPDVVLPSEAIVQHAFSWEFEKLKVPVEETETESPSSVSSISRSEFHSPASDHDKEDAVEEEDETLYAGSTSAGKGKTYGLRDSASCRIPHDRYYLKDGNVVFLVENTLFKVHRYVFERDSPYFRDLFAAAARWVPPAWQRGTRDADPLVLEGIRPEDFAIFLSIIYPTNYDSHDAKTSEDWATILIMSHVWSFDSIHRLSQRELLPLLENNPIDRLILARRCAIQEWLRDAYMAVCTRPEALNEEEGEGLGVREVVKISRLRQELRAGLHGQSYEGIVRVIERTFGLVSSDNDERKGRESATDVVTSEGPNAENTESATVDIANSEKLGEKAGAEDDKSKEPETEEKVSFGEQKLFEEEARSPPLAREGTEGGVGQEKDDVKLEGMKGRRKKNGQRKRN